MWWSSRRKIKTSVGYQQRSQSTKMGQSYAWSLSTSWERDQRFTTGSISPSFESLPSKCTATTSRCTSPSDLEWWTELVERIRNRSPVTVSANVRDAGITYRITFAFFKNDVLKTNLDNLARTVDELDKFTTHQYWKLRWSYTISTPTDLDVESSLNLQRIRGKYTDFASLLYRRQMVKNAALGDLNERQWSLELRQPDNRGDINNLSFLDRTHFDFCLADRFSRPLSDLKRARILYTPSGATVWQQELS